MDIAGLTDLATLRETVARELPLLAGRVLVALLILAVSIGLGRVAASTAVRTLRDQRGGTLVPIVQKGIGVIAWVVGGVMALDHLGIDVATLLAGAGIVGLAIGFGAQSLVKDLISGFFILFEDVLRVGDVATVGAATGMVEEVGLRMTKLRALNGQLWYIPNGDITSVGNYNRAWTRALVEVGLAYEEDVGRGLEVLRQVGETWAAENPDMVLEPPEVQGVLALGDSSVNVRLVVKVLPNELWGVERELRRRIKDAFDEAGVEIPFPRQVVYHRQEQEEGALRVASSDSKALAG